MHTEVEEDMMTLRALNDNRSAFAAIEFERNFFDSFLLVQRDQPFACKLAVKVCALISFIFADSLTSSCLFFYSHYV